MRIALKYCGSCNPEADLSQVGRQLAEMARERGWGIGSLSGDENPDVLVLLCGCPRTCVDSEEMRDQAQHCLVVGGKRVGWRAVSEAELPAAIVRTLEGVSS